MTFLEKPSSEKLKEIPVPDNQPELLSMQCRRVILHRKGDAVVGYTEAAGEYIEKESAFVEQMTFWGVKKDPKGIQKYFPKQHDSSRQMWRDFSVLLGNSARKPGVVAWIGMLKNKKIIPKDNFITFKIVGVEYGSMTCGIVDEFSDSLQFHAGLLDDLGRKWQKHITEEIERCDRLVLIIGRLGRDLEKAAGGDGISAEKRTKEQAYYSLDVPFRQWLLKVDPEQGLEEQNRYRQDWRNLSIKIIKNLGRELVEQSGITAIAGRKVKEKIKQKETEWHYSAPEAFNYFLYQLRQCDN